MWSGVCFTTGCVDFSPVLNFCSLDWNVCSVRDNEHDKNALCGCR